MKERVFLTVGSSTGIRPSRRERFALESRSPVTNNMKLVDKQTEIFLRRSAIMGKRTKRFASGYDLVALHATRTP